MVSVLINGDPLGVGDIQNEKQKKEDRERE